MTSTQPSPGTLLLVRGTPNPNSLQENRLFLLVGNPSAAPIRHVVPAGDVEIPAPPSLAGHPFRLCILHFNDLHGQVSHITPDGDRPVFSRMVWRLRQLRSQSPRQNRSSPGATLYW